MSEDYLVRHCAPTLAGLKTGNLFTCPCNNPQALRQTLRQINRRLMAKGLRVLPLHFSGKKALIYVYRPGMLSTDLQNRQAEQILHGCGYAMGSCEKCIAQLSRRIRCQSDFPHEIGLFLGYPPEDVQGFMENQAENAKCTGCWKVYGDPEAARKKFAQYKKCTRVYCEQWKKGKDIERLTVAG